MYRVLLIEDEIAYQKVLKDALEEENLNVVVASDGRQGMVEVAKNLPDFILLDLMMPGMNGTTFLNHINSVEGLNNVPLAVLTVVPDGVPQKLQGEELFNNIVGYWVKDTLSPKKITEKVKDYLLSQPNKDSVRITTL